MTPQLKNKIGYWVSNKWYLHKKVKIKYVYSKIHTVINTECKELCKNHRFLKTFPGTPDESVWPGVSQLPDYKSTFPKWPQRNVSCVLPILCEEGIDLITVSEFVFVGSGT